MSTPEATIDMTLVINTVNGRGLSNKVSHELLQNKSKVMLSLLTIHFAIKGVLPVVHQIH